MMNKDNALKACEKAILVFCVLAAIYFFGLSWHAKAIMNASISPGMDAPGMDGLGVDSPGGDAPEDHREFYGLAAGVGGK